MRLAAASILLIAAIVSTACADDDPFPPFETAVPSIESSGTVTPTLPPVLVPPESQAPAAGVCEAQPDSSVVAFELVEGAPSPACAQVGQSQTLRFDNHTGQTVMIEFAGRTITITDGQSADLEERVAAYLAPGVHVAHVDFYGGSGPEVWVLP